jgi:hypothetical protein
MDYAIYKTNDGMHPRIIHRFYQVECNRQAKKAAQTKLNEMWLHILDRPELYRNANGNKNDFSYDHPTSTNTKERIRFYIAKM